MTQPTIKEKMEQVIETIAGYVTHFEMNGMKNAEEYIEKSREELRDFARLICEEVMEEGEVDAYNAKPGQCARCYEYDDCSCGGYYQRIEEEKLKAEEILKALE